MENQWRERAECRGMDPALFIVPRDDSPAREAKAVCSRCPVYLDCLDYAFEIRDEEAVLGGLTPKERRRLKRQRAAYKRETLKVLRAQWSVA